MGQDIGHRVADLLLLELGFGLGYGEIVAPALIGRQDRQQDDGEHSQDHAEQSRSCLGEGLVSGGGAGQADDLRIDGVIT